MSHLFKSQNAGRILLFIVLTGFAVLARLVEHLPNFTPVAALGLFGGYLFRSRLAGSLSVLFAMFISDLIIGYESLTMRVVVYLSLFLPVFLGAAIKNLKGHKLGFALIGSSLLSSITFYITTNFAVWVLSGMYEHTMQGLILCYTYALPFLRNTMIGDLFYTGVFFGIHAAVRHFAWRSAPSTV
jgi:hypothetical protein